MTATHDSRLAGRAVGAMFFFAFGGAWLEYYAVLALAGNPVALIGIALVAACLLLVAYARYRRSRPRAADARPATATELRVRRVFNWVNAAQWLAIVVVGNVLVHMHMGEWAIPAVIMIVGLHLIPLAWNFSYRAHYLTGAALIVLAIAYPLLAPTGPRSPIGCLGAGLILWASALWALKRGRAPPPTPSRNTA